MRDICPHKSERNNSEDEPTRWVTKKARARAVKREIDPLVKAARACSELSPEDQRAALARAEAESHNICAHHRLAPKRASELRALSRLLLKQTLAPDTGGGFARSLAALSCSLSREGDAHAAV